MRRILFCFIITGLLPLAAVAQENLPVYPPLVYGAAFTATRVTTTYQKLADGTQISHEDTEWEARDSRGYTWHRQIIENKDALRRDGKKYEVVVVWDPEHLTRTNWCSCNHVAWVKQYAPFPATSEREHKPSPPNGMDAYLGPRTERLKFRVEKLPPEIIQNMDTEGTLATRVVKAGMDGNDHDLVTTIKSWYSPELHLAMRTIIDDPQKGLKKLEITELKRADPAPEIFMIPAGYAVKPEVDVPR